MDLRRCTSLSNTAPLSMGAVNFINRVHEKVQMENHEETSDYAAPMDADVDLREIYFLIMHFLSTGPCQKSFRQLWTELLEHELLPRRYHAWYSRSGEACGEENDNGNSFPLNYDKLVERYSHIEKNHLVKLLKQLMLITSPPFRSFAGNVAPSATDVPTLLGAGSFSLLSGGKNRVIKQARNVPSYLRWPHMQADQVRGLRLREIGGGFSKHHRAPSIRFACYAIAKPSVVVGKMQNQKKLRGHRDAVYCAIFDRTGRYVITGSDDRLVKIWSMETAFCLSSCRGHEGDITDLSVSSNNALVASASNDYSIRVWRVPDGLPISVLRGHMGAVTAIAFCPRPNAVFHLLSSSDDGTCRIWDARSSQYSPRVYSPKPTDAAAVKSSGLPSASSSSSTVVQSHQILCCAYNANGTVFVTGSSDTFARVWNACSKPNTNDPGQPTHEIDILAGHENDVNYVQFSGCAVASRASPSESFVEDSIPKFKNYWFSHDNIVTCSRDGSAIIWIPKSRRSHNKVARWIRAYHLKVPPPPMPPQPPRGGPRQRLLPTPRGVNMIVWSLDNRFVLAAIMDNRICVWNANDGSLVHSLAGHTASTYVLDVHPFNPRIAMSAGYDGKTILWDIWEGTPIRVYEIDGRYKLVDGKFSQDGTSIVLSDDVGQIYLLNTGEGESQKDAKYEQFFLGDYRPLTRDTHGNVVDQETQLVPYYRNIQDRLCDSNMFPYPEPYQSMYQRSRLGALGIEWRPSSIKFAIGTDIGMGQESQILPLADLDVVLEPLPDYLDSLYWEPENDVMNDDNDSEYNATEEHFSDEQTFRSDNSSIDSDCSEEDKIRRNQKDSMRRSKRKKSILEIDSMISSSRRIRKRITDEQDGSLSKNKRYKKSKIGQRTSRRKSIKQESSRPQRVTTFNAINKAEDSTDEEDEYVSMSDSSDSESSYETSASDEQMKHTTVASGSEDVVKPFQHPDFPINIENKKKLVVRFSLSRTAPRCSENQASAATSTSRATEDIPEEVRVNSISRDLGSSSPSVVRFSLNRTAPKCSENQASAATSTCRATEDIPEEVRVNSISRDLGSSSPSIVDTEFSENLKGADIELRASTSCTNAHIRWGKLKVRTSSSTQLGDVVPKNVNAIKNNGCLTDEDKQNSGEGEKGSSSSHICGPSNVIVDAKEHAFEPQDNPKKKLIVLKLKSSKVPGNSNKPPGNDSLGASDEKYSSVEGKPILEFPGEGNRHYEPNHMPHLHINCEEETEVPELAADAVRRSRSLKLKSSSQEIGLVNSDFDVDGDYLQPGTSRGSEKSSKKAVNHFSEERWMSTPKHIRSRSSRNKREDYYSENRSALVEMNSDQVPKKLHWLLLLEQEEGYRYIPQLGDEVVYLSQGHQEYIESSKTSKSGPWQKYKDKMRAVEVCEVEDLNYTELAGSGSSCCQITLKFLETPYDYSGVKFQLILPELNDFPDFIIEKMRYDAAMDRKWTTGNKCRVWWRDESENGGAWWDGRIVDVKDKSSGFPGSPWERYVVRYKDDTTDHFHSPWEFQDPMYLQNQPKIDYTIKEKISVDLADLVQKARKDQDRFGILKLNEIALRSDFMNRFPAPLSPKIIQLRLDNNYYRSLKALRHDIEVMISNAKSYFIKKVDFLKKMSRLFSYLNNKVLSDYE